MEENSVNKLLEIQTLIINIVKDNQIQITDLKSYLDKDNPKFYKDIILINKSEVLEEIYTKSEYRMKYYFNLNRVENFLSLADSLGKVIDLNNSIKTVLMYFYE